MPLRLDVKRRLLARSDRVKSVDLHPTESWMLVSLYNGNVHIWNYDNQQLVKSFEVCDLPVRAARFVPRKNWVVTGSDDMQVRVFNYNTLERVHAFEAHSDYLRSMAVHPTQPFLLTSSDDMLLKLWDWDNKWTCKQVFEGHTHYVMQVVINPKDNNTFATASLDRTIKVWQLGSSQPNFTLEGHDKGVNTVDYYHGGDKPYLISGADDRLVKIWDYQNKTCVATLEGHAQNISAVCFHPELPIILTGSEDSTVRVWHANTYRLETTLNYGLERVWAIMAQRGSNTVAIGYDEGSVIVKLGREEPAVSMDASGKILWARHSEIQQANLKVLGGEAGEVGDGERLPLSVKDMGACEIYPQTIQHNPNGRFVVVCGDGEYIIYTAMALRNKSYGAAVEFAWAADANMYAVRESGSTVKMFKNFKETRVLKPDYTMDGLYGGSMLGVRSANSLCFYDWENMKLIRRIELVPMVNRAGLTAAERDVLQAMKLSYYDNNHRLQKRQTVRITDAMTVFIKTYLHDMLVYSKRAIFNRCTYFEQLVEDLASAEDYEVRPGREWDTIYRQDLSINRCPELHESRKPLLFTRFKLGKPTSGTANDCSGPHYILEDRLQDIVSHDRVATPAPPEIEVPAACSSSTDPVAFAQLRSRAVTADIEEQMELSQPPSDGSESDSETCPANANVDVSNESVIKQLEAIHSMLEQLVQQQQTGESRTQDEEPEQKRQRTIEIQTIDKPWTDTSHFQQHWLDQIKKHQSKYLSTTSISAQMKTWLQFHYNADEPSASTYSCRFCTERVASRHFDARYIPDLAKPGGFFSSEGRALYLKLYKHSQLRFHQETVQEMKDSYKSNLEASIAQYKQEEQQKLTVQHTATAMMIRTVYAEVRVNIPFETHKILVKLQPVKSHTQCIGPHSASEVPYLVYRTSLSQRSPILSVYDLTQPAKSHTQCIGLHSASKVPYSVHRTSLSQRSPILGV